MSRSRSRSRGPMIGAVIVGGVWLVVWALDGGSPTPQAYNPPPLATGPSSKAAGASRAPVVPETDPAVPPSRDADSVVSSDGRVTTPSSAQSVEADEVEPRAARQPRTFYVQDLASALRGGGWEVDGVVLVGEALSLSDRFDDLNPRRVGSVTSPGVPMDFPANMLTPLWRLDAPEGTAVAFEMAVGQDGETWGPWHPMEADADAVGAIRPTFPDGRPNPNYGYTPGGILAFGLEKWSWFRYRITLTSEGLSAPSVSSVRVFYQDTTLGRGRMAEL